MGVRLTPPTRREPIVLKGGDPTLRLSTYLESVADTIVDLPDVIDPEISELTGPGNAAANQAKINEILAAMRTAGLMV